MIKDIMDGLEREGQPIDSKDRMEYEQILAHTGNWKVPQVRTESEAWKSLGERINSEAKVVRFQPWIKWAASVAVIALLAGSFFILKPDTQYYSAQQLKEVPLPDGSSILLGAGSEVSFTRDLFGERKVELKGRAFFEVAEGGEFVVETANGSVSVLGTSFNVNSYGNNLRVECFTGQVRVSTQSGNATLTPGLSVITENGQLKEVVSFDEARAKSWIDGEFYYENSPLSEVFSEIEKQYEVTIYLENINENRRYSGLFSKADDLNTTLESICAPMGLKYALTGEQLYKISR